MQAFERGISKIPIVFSRRANRRKIERSKVFRKNPTESERRLWSLLRAHRMNGLHFRRQVVIDPYIVDFYCHEVRLVFEVDGKVHLGQIGMDAERDRFLEALGLRVVHVVDEMVDRNEVGVISIIKESAK